MYCNKPCTEKVGEVVEDVRVGNAVDGCVGGDEEEEDACQKTDARLYAGYHAASAESFDEKDEGHD